MSLTATALSTMPIRVVHAPEPNRLLAIPRKEGHVVFLPVEANPISARSIEEWKNLKSYTRST